MEHPFCLANAIPTKMGMSREGGVGRLPCRCDRGLAMSATVTGADLEGEEFR